MAPQANTALRVTELDFGSIKENLKTFLRSQKTFQDYDFDGAGMSVLLDILAYNTHYMSYYLNMVGNEMFLDTAQVRNSILSHAKAINYVPQSRIAATARVDIRITPSNTEDQDNQIITLDRYHRFMGQDIDGVNYPFVAAYSNTVYKSGGSFLLNDIILKQGEVITRQFRMATTNTKRAFSIPTANVDINTLVVSVQNSSTDTNAIVYNRADDMTTLTPNSTVYFVEERPNLTYAVYFGDGVIGKKPVDGNIVRITYIDTSGPDGNKIQDFVAAQRINGYNSNVAITAAGPSFGGSERESVEQIRFRAPYFYSTQNRAVTKQDYETLLKKDYPYIQSVAVWGGEDNIPVQYGKVYISIKTIDNYALSELEKENIKDSLIKNRNVLTVTPEIVDPEIVYVKLRGKVTYNPKLTTLSTLQIKSLVYAAIQDYVDEDLNRFDSVFRKSKLQFFIDNADASITASDLDLYVQKRKLLEPGLVKNYTFSFGMPIRQGDFINRLTSYPKIGLLDGNGVQRMCFLEEVPESSTGIARIAMRQLGSGYISKPTVKIIGDGTGATAEATVVNGKIQSIKVLTPGSNYTRAEVSISGGGGTGGVASAITDASIGSLRAYYNKTNGVKVIVKENVGEINYAQGTVSLYSFFPVSLEENDLYELDNLTLNVPTENEILYPRRNTILTLDTNDPSAITIEVIPET